MANAGFYATRYTVFEGLIYFIIFFTFKVGKFLNKSIVGVYGLLFSCALCAKIATIISLTSVASLGGPCDKTTLVGVLEPVCAGISIYCNLVLLFISIVHFFWVMFYRRCALQRVPEPEEKLKSE